MRRPVAIALALALGAGAASSAGTAGADRAASRSTTSHAVARVRLARCARQRLAVSQASAARGDRLAVAAPAPPPRRLRACGLGHLEPAIPRKPVAAAVQAPRPTDLAVGPAAGGAPVPATGAAPAPPGAAPPPPVVSTLGVSAYDRGGFLLILTRNSVPAGELTVFFRNEDVSDHNLWIEGPGDVLERISDTLGGGAGAFRTLPVTPGRWRLFCSLPDHGAMTRTLSVGP
jgi:hypothetical protein